MHTHTQYKHAHTHTHTHMHTQKVVFDDSGSMVQAISPGPSSRPPLDQPQAGKKGQQRGGVVSGMQADKHALSRGPGSKPGKLPSVGGGSRSMGGGIGGAKGQRPPPPAVSGSNGGSNGVSKVNVAKGKAPNIDYRPMHPSWEAKQQARKLQKLREAGAKPEGKKTVFLD